MNRNKALFLIGICVVLTACATQAPVPTAVGLKISSDTASKRFVSDIRNATLNAIRAQAPNARPMTVAVNFDVVTRLSSAPTIVSSTVNEERALPPVSRTPASEGAVATVSVHNSAFGSTTESTEDFTNFRVSYTITDVQGRIIESNRLRLDHGYLIDEAAGTPVNGSGKTNVFSAYRHLVGNTAHFLAARVKTLS